MLRARSGRQGREGCRCRLYLPDVALGQICLLLGGFFLVRVGVGVVGAGIPGFLLVLRTATPGEAASVTAVLKVIEEHP